MKLYEMTKEMLILEHQLEEMEGNSQVNMGLQVELDAIMLSRSEKLYNIIAWIKNLEAEQEAYKAEEKRLKAKRETLERRAESLTEYLKYNVKTGEKVQVGIHGIGWRKSDRIIQACALDKVPACYLEPQPPRVKLAEIKKDIKAGSVIEGFTVVQIENINIK